MNRDYLSDQNKGEEVDIIEIAIRVWSKRIFVVKVTAISVVIGLFVAIFSPVKFQSESVFVLQSSKSISSGSLGSLAQLAGISLGDIGGSGDLLSPLVYTNILNNINFQKELIHTPFDFKDYENPTTLFEDYIEQRDNRNPLIKYTIGLPSTIIKAIRGDREDVGASSKSPIQYYTNDEAEFLRELSGQITLTVNDKDGYISISAIMAEPLLAAQVTQQVQNMLQRYITEFKIGKAKQNYEFVKERYEEAKSDFEDKQLAYIRFSESNKILTSVSARIMDEKLSSVYNIASSTYNELCVQLVQAEISLKEDTPIFTIIEPVKIPNLKYAPRRMIILIGFTFLGIVVSIGLVLLLDNLKSRQLDIRFLNSWD